MKAANRHSALRFAAWLAAILIPALNPSDGFAGPTPGRESGSCTRKATKAVPRTLKHSPKGSATASNPADPMAGVSTLVTGSSRDSRSGESLRFKLQFDQTGGDAGVVMGARVRLRQDDGGSRLTPVRFRGSGPGTVTSNSFSTSSGTGRLGRFPAKFTAIAISPTPGQLVIRINVTTRSAAPTGRRFSATFRPTF